MAIALIYSARLVEALEPYFASEFFDGLNDVHLGLASLRDAAQNGRGMPLHFRCLDLWSLGESPQCADDLALPISQLLSAIGRRIFGELVEQDLCLRRFGPADDIRREAAHFQRQVIDAFRTCVDVNINKICTATTAARYEADGGSSAERNVQQAQTESTTAASPLTPSARWEPSRSLKRHIGSDRLGGASPAGAKGTKKARNDRLLEAIRAAQGTIEDMAEQEVEDAENQLDLEQSGIAGVSIFAL